MKEGMFQDKVKGIPRCKICPNNCVIPEGKAGICGIRGTKDGKVQLLAYGQVSGMNVDPIEKKPLYHFFPSKEIFSIGSFGCNMSCLFCQNYDISTIKAENLAPGKQEFTPEEIIKFCEESGTRMIAFTYNEPTITYEFVYDTAKLAKEKGIKTVLVTNGFINIEPLKELAKYIDAANIDLKGFDEKFYREICGARLKPVLEAIKEYKKAKVWIELTNLLIPGKNDNPEKIEEMCKWIKENVGKETPLHFSRFFPMHKMTDVPQTEMKTLLEAKRIAKKYLDFVYVGNITDDELNSTFCPKCKKLIIERTGYSTKSLLDGDKCPFCKTKIAGVFER